MKGVEEEKPEYKLSLKRLIISDVIVVGILVSVIIVSIIVFLTSGDTSDFVMFVLLLFVISCSFFLSIWYSYYRK